MSLIERARSLALGPAVAPPEELGDGAVPEGVVVRRGRLVPAIAGVLGRMGGPAAAVTLGRSIVVRPGTRLTPSLLAHELVHVRQWREVPLFPLRYALASLRYGYRDNPYEVEARGEKLPGRETPSPEDSA